MSQTATIKICTVCRAEVSADLEKCPADGAALEPLPNEALIGKVFAGKYEVQSVLGQGGMSIVYKARHLFMKRDVAIKVLHSHLTKDTSSLERFKQEAEAASALNHQNIITVYDFGLSREGQAYLIMECFNGPTLADILENEKRISPKRALNALRQICSGLDHAHRNGVVHRDLKPSNLCLVQAEDGSEILKIVDFGIAKMVPQEGAAKRQQLTQAEQIFGSPLFMSPEQCQGKPLDARSDLYSVGCLMYEALTGVPPLMGDTSFDTMHMHINEKPKPMKRAAPEIEVSPELETPLMQCLEKDPANRPQTAAELLADLPPEELAHTTGQFMPSWYKSLRHNPPARAAVNTLVTCVVILIPLLIIYFKWPGPDSDRGTMHDRMRFSVCTWIAERAMSDKNYPMATQMLDRAERLARTFGDNNSRLLGTLNQEARLGMEEGNFEYAEEANHEIIDVLNARAREAALAELAALNELEKLAHTPENAQKGILAAEARVGRIEYAARDLGSRQIMDLQEKLLRRAIEVDKDLLAADPEGQHRRLERRIAELTALLADCLIRQQRPYDEIRKLLVESRSLFDKNEGAGSADAVRTLLKLGQFDRDQSQYTVAEKELKDAIALATDNPNVSPDLLKECKNSYEDYQAQLARVSAQDKTLFHGKK